MEFRLTFMVEKVSYLTQINKAKYTQHHQLGEYVFVWFFYFLQTYCIYRNCLLL